MFRTTCFIALLATAAACSDSPVAPVGRWAAEPEDPGFETVIGTVVSETVLRRDDGSMVPLLGPQTTLLKELVGAEIQLLGSPDEVGSSALWILEFRVLVVDGLPALNGTLTFAENGYAVELGEGDIEFVQSIPEDLAAHLGKRVWLTTANGHCIRYGVLEM